MGPHGSISEFVKAYLINQIQLEGKISQETITFHAVKENHIQNVICPALTVILALKKINFLTTRAMVEGQYFSNCRCETMKKLFLCNNFIYSIQMS